MFTSHEFYANKGGFAIVIARFLSIVKTFAPIVAGTAKIDFKKFTFLIILGAIIWVGSLTSLGYISGDNLWVRRNLEFITVGIMVIVTLPVIFKHV